MNELVAAAQADAAKSAEAKPAEKSEEGIKTMEIDPITGLPKA
mgnify:CR=1 FL=1